MAWTQFRDMHSGGDTKIEPYQIIYIEAPEKQARTIFYNRFGHNPGRVTCTCCGEDYTTHESPDLAQASGYDRGCAFGYLVDGVAYTEDDWQALPQERRHELGGGVYFERPEDAPSWRRYETLDSYLQRADVLFILAADILPAERKGKVRKKGYKWRD